MNKTLLLTALCALGATLAMPAAAHDDRGRRHDRYEYRHYDRHDDRYERRVVYRPRHVVHGRYCNDRRHYRGVHYHVPTRYYYASDYPRHAYPLHGRSRVDATLIVTLPLF